MHEADVAIIGGGIVGLATAYRIKQRAPDLSLIVLEKESDVARHQSGHNSGVLHAGIYYTPGSLKAKTCLKGKAEMVEFCRQHAIPHELCGKVIVAVDESELPSLERIYQRGQANEVPCTKIDRKQLLELEPHAAGVAAIHVPGTGIVNYPAVCRTHARLIREGGDQVLVNSRVTEIKREGNRISLTIDKDKISCKHLVNCGGLHSDRVMRLSGLTPPVKIVPFRGEYYDMKPEAHSLCRNLIYPVPDPNFPFLGVHFTRMIEGGVECGPNAVLALAREGYSWGKINLSDLSESITYGGFLKIARKFWRMGAGEVWRSVSKQAFVAALQRLIPSIRSDHLKPGRSGVRAQAIAPNGTMVDDFLIVERDNMVHVCNAPSPGATASLEIGNVICTHVLDQVTASQSMSTVAAT